MFAYHFTFVSQNIHQSESYVYSSKIYFGKEEEEEKAKEDLIKITNETLSVNFSVELIEDDFAESPSLERFASSLESYSGKQGHDVYIVEIIVRKNFYT